MAFFITWRNKHSFGRKSLRFRSHDIFLAPYLRDCAFHQHEISGGPVKDHDDQRKKHMLKNALHPCHTFHSRRNHAVDGKQFHPISKKDQKDQAEAVRWDRIDHQKNRSHDLVKKLSRFPSGNDSQKSPEKTSDDPGRNRQKKGPLCRL